MIALFSRFACPLHCGWYVVVNKLVSTRALRAGWKNLDLKCDQFSDKSHFGGPCVSTQLSANAFATDPTEIFVRGTVLTNLENRLVMTIINLFPLLVVTSWPRMSIAMNSGGASLEIAACLYCFSEGLPCS